MLLLDLTVAYLAARRHKTKSEAHKRFVKRLKENLFKLCDDIRNGTYVIAPSIYFIQMNPIQREVFAGNFRDRIVHHLIYNYIYPYRDKQFIYDSYSCREGKGTSMGVERIAKFCRSSTDCYTKEAWIMKLDIQGYFMSIDRAILRKKVNDYLSNRENLPGNTPKTKDDTSEIDNLEREELRKKIEEIFLDGSNKAMSERREQLHYTKRYYGKFPEFLLKVVYDIIYNNPTENGIFRGHASDYDGLPKTKSLFFARENCGLPIGNLTSQLFSNVYLNDFDHFVKEELKIKYYGRYVDDFIMIHNNKEYLLSLKPIIREYLDKELHLTLHPLKNYLQTVNKGVEFLGTRIKPFRIYRAKRTIKNFYRMIRDCRGRPQRESIDSYLGLMQHYKCYKIIQKILNNLDEDWCAENISDYTLSFLNKEKRAAILRKRYKKPERLE